LLFADAASLSRIGTYKSNRLLPSTQTTETLENLHYNTQSRSWVESATYKAEQKSLFGAMTSEDWQNFDACMKTNPKAKEGVEWLLSEYIWGNGCTVSGTELDGLISKFAAANPKGNNGANYDNSITLQCPQDTSFALLTEKLVTAGVLKQSTRVAAGVGADTLWVSTPEAVASNGAAYANYRYRKYGKVDNWIDSEWQEVAPESKINKGDYILWMTPNNR